jgi:zinc/manganese transport system permease protein
VSLAADPIAAVALKSAAAGALALALGGAPLGVLLIARRMSLMGDGLSHGLLPGVAIAYLLAGPDPVALTIGALIAAVAVAGAASLFARLRSLPEDASFAVFYLSALAGGILILGGSHDAEAVHHLLLGDSGAFDAPSLILAASAATATLICLALFLRGFLAEGADPTFMRSVGAPGWLLHLLLTMLVAVNLVAGYRAFGALMTIGLMMIPAAAARFWARGYVGQAAVAVVISAAASGAGLVAAQILGREPGPIMVLAAAVLFLGSWVFGVHNGLIQNLPGRAHLEG